MKVCLIGPGYKPIPPIGWGAVESVIWDYYINLKNMGIEVDIINNRDLQNVIIEVNNKHYDVVHIMYDDHIVIAPYIKQSCKLLYTSHYAYITSPNFETGHHYYYNNVFKNVIKNKDRVVIFAISEDIRQKYISHGYPENKVYLMHNGARDDMFEFIESPTNIEKSVYLAKIETRKRQYVYQSIPNIDFVGNYHNSGFDRSNKNYLGEWNKDVLYKNLSSYGNLVLLSDGEADPLVVKEGLICGLGVVVSECSAANIDTTHDFIDIIPNNRLNDIVYVGSVINKNREISKKKRNTIRQYGLETFGWKGIVSKYKMLLENLCKD